MEGTMMHQPLLVDALLARAGTLFPRVEVVSRMADRILVRHDYARVLGRARRLASALTRAGLRSGDRVIVFKEGMTVEDAALREHLSATFPKWALPDRFVARAEIPRTSTGKFLKSKLREELGQTPNRS